MLTLYDSKFSGNAWKVRMLLRRRGMAFKRVSIDLAAGDSKTPEFTAKSRFQRVPVLQLEDGRTIVESGAMLLYLADGTALLPDEPVARAEVVSWLFFDQADLTKPLALPRFFHLRGLADKMADRIRPLHEQGYVALDRLEARLGGHDWLAEERCTLADLACYPYVAMAHQGGYDMARYDAIGRWLKRVEAEPGWEPLVAEDAP